MVSAWRVSMISPRPAGGAHGFCMSQTSTIWPHELFAGLWEHNQQAFQTFILGGGVEVVQRFWARMPPRPAMQDRPQWQRKCIPLALHGDGVAITNIRGKASKSMDTLSWSSLLSTAPTKYSVFLIWVCFAHMAKTRGFSTTWTMFWKRLSKSLLALWQGTWPHEDMEGNIDPRGGQPLAGGFFAIPYVCRGDLDWMAHHYGLNHTGSATPCSLCRCTNHGEDEIPWTDCNSPPRWLRTCLDDEVLGYRLGNVSLNLCNFPLQKPKLEQSTMAQDLWSFTLKSRESEQKGVPTKAVNPRLLCKNILMLILSFDQIRHQVEGSAFTNQTTCIPNCWVWMLIYLEVAWPIWSKRSCPSQLTTMSLPCGKQFRSTTSSTILLVGLGALLRIC